jgi:phosphonate transport system ATP-binding protein
VAFDLPAASVSRERLQALYAQHEHELRGEVPASAAAALDATLPVPAVVAHCR